MVTSSKAPDRYPGTNRPLAYVWPYTSFVVSSTTFARFRDQRLRVSRQRGRSAGRGKSPHGAVGLRHSGCSTGELCLGRERGGRRAERDGETRKARKKATTVSSR